MSSTFLCILSDASRSTVHYSKSRELYILESVTHSQLTDGAFSSILKPLGETRLPEAAAPCECGSLLIERHRDAAFFIPALLSFQARGKSTTHSVTQSFSLKRGERFF